MVVVEVEHNRQGNWGYFVEFSQTPRYSPYTVNTGLSGIGTINQAVGGEPTRDVQLKTERKTTTLGFDKWLPAKFDFQVRFRHEEKDGSRYQMTMELKAGNLWNERALPFNTLTMADDSKDENGKIDAEQIKQVTIVDVSALLGADVGGANTLYLDQVYFTLSE